MFKIFNFEQLFILSVGLLVFIVVIDLVFLGKYIYKKVLLKNKVSEAKPRLVRQFIKKVFKLNAEKIEKFRKTFKIPLKAFRIFREYSLILFNLIILIFAIYTFHNLFFTSPGVVATYPQAEGKWDDYTKPIEIEFDRPISVSKVTPNSSPEIKGKWEFEKSFAFLPFSRKAKFYPEQSVLPETNVLVYVAGITNHIETVELWEKLLEFESAPLPNITQISPPDKSTDITTDSDIVIDLSEKDGEFVNWDVSVEPQVPLQIIRNFENKLTVMPIENLGQGKEYKFTVTRTAVTYDYKSGEVVEKKEPELLGETTFSTVKAPSIDSFTPEGIGVMPAVPVKVVFDKDMMKSEVEAHFSINPPIDGTFSWEDDKTFIFSPTGGWDKATKYSVTFTNGFKNKFGGVVEQDIVSEFETIGYVKATFSPGSGSTRTRRATNIIVTFDQEVDHASAQSKFSTSPSVAGTFSWDGNSMTFNPSEDLAWGTRYTANIASGVKSIHGFDSNTAYSTSFTVETQSFVLNVPAYYQTDRFACNLIAAKIVLSYRGVNKSQYQIQSEIGIDSTPWNPDANTWGNPHNAYVGDVTGNSKGYGVYWQPVANMIGKYRSVEVKRGWNTSDLAKTIEEGNPVILWWQNGWSTPTWYSWNTPSGTKIDALQGMHSEVAIGFNGSSDNPTSIIVQDPWRGRRTISISTFKSLWSYFNNTGVIVY